MINTKKHLAVTWLIIEENIANIINNNYHINSIIRNTSKYHYLDKLIESIKDNPKLMHNVLIDFEEKNQNEDIVNNISQKINELSKKLKDQGLENFNFIYGWNPEEFKEKLIKNLGKNEYSEIQDNLKKGFQGETIGMIIDNHKLLLALYLMRIKNIEDLYIIDFDVLPDIKKISNFYEEKKLPFQFCLLSMLDDIRVSEGLIYFKNIAKIQEIITKLIKIKGELNCNLRSIKNKIILLSSEDLSIENINNNIKNFDIEDFYFYKNKVNDKYNQFILNVINDYIKLYKPNDNFLKNTVYENLQYRYYSYLEFNNKINEYFNQDLKDKSQEEIIKDITLILHKIYNNFYKNITQSAYYKESIKNSIENLIPNSDYEDCFELIGDLIKDKNKDKSILESLKESIEIEGCFLNSRYVLNKFERLTDKIEDISGLTNIMYFLVGNEIYKNPSNRSYEKTQKEMVNENITTTSITKTTSSKSK